MTGSTMPCPHCGARNPVGSAFCQSCGKAVPTGYSTGPRVVGAGEFAGTAAGQKLQGDELTKQAKKASGALLAVAIIQTAATAIIYAIAQSASSRLELDTTVIAIMAVIAAIFWGLWFWSRVSPLPAAIVGLVLYGSLLAVNVVMRVSQMNETGQRGTGIGGIGIGWLDIVIIVVLVQGIQAGAKHRKLMQQQAMM